MSKIIIANWKMRLSVEESLNLAAQLSLKLKNSKNKIVVCPDFLSLPLISSLFKNPFFVLGAQDSASCLSGSWTGEVSPLNLKELDVSYVILGHSERREGQRENNEMINLKIKAALLAGLKPVLCVGENLVQRKNKEEQKVLVNQVKEALKGVKIKNGASLLLAYEPLWAIGSGQAINPLEAAELNNLIAKTAQAILKNKVGVLYGGSVDGLNAVGFLKQKDIAGLLVGGASLKAEEFIKICS